MFKRIKGFKIRLRNLGESLLEITALRLVWHTVKEFGNIDGTQRAAGVAYYAVLSIFPLLLGLIALFGFFLPSLNLQKDLLQFVGNNLPGATDILQQNITGIIRMRGVLGAFSLILFFWSGSAMFSALSLAINRAWEVHQVRPFYIRKASELGMALSLGILFLLSLGASALISILTRVFSLPAANLIIVNAGGRLAAFLLVLAVFILLYKLIPNVRTHWRYVWPGALLAAILFEAARTLFVFYLENFANYHLIYGSISSIIVFLVWIYYSAFIIILGAKFTYEYSRLHKRSV